MAKVLLGLGCNMGDCIENMQKAYAVLAKEESILVASSLYKSEPWGVEEQTDFINAIVEIETKKTPNELLSSLQNIEKILGRNREQEERWGPRSMDIDIIFWEDKRIESRNLTIPHPFWSERDFVVIPLAEIENKIDECFSFISFAEIVETFADSSIEKVSTFLPSKTAA